jgi:hypothetical protein
MNDTTWSWLQESEDDRAERAAFSETLPAALLLLEPEIELEPPVPTGFESFWK